MARKIDTKEFIRMAHLVHGDKYDYSNSNYTRGKDPIIITCRRHGDYIQRASTHLRGSGCPKCFQERNGGIVCGIGVNDIGQSDIGLFTTWRGMLFRCYDKKYNSAYSGCEVCDEWKTLSKFAVWYYDNHKEGWQLDKDILGDGKLYSPKDCCFVPSEINMCLVGKDSNGITFVKGKWQASFSQKYIGRYDNKEDATNAYKQEKGKHIRSLAEKYSPVLPTRVYDKLKEHALRLCGVGKEVGMTRKQQIEGEARRRNPYVGGTKGDISSALMAEFIAGAEWADLTMIDKAVAWLEQNADRYIYNAGTGDDFAPKMAGSMYEDFRKAMEE